jgi:ornithine carrier protein
MEVSKQTTPSTQTQPTVKDDTIAAGSKMSAQGKEALKDIVFGSFAGIVGKVIEYPFDTVKVRLQAQPDHLPLRYTGPLDCFRQSLRQDGVVGLYRGISAPLFGAAVETSSLFFSVGWSTEELINHHANKRDSID